MPLLVCVRLSAPQEIDEYDLVDPVDILGPLEKAGFWDGVVSASASLFHVFSVLDLSNFLLSSSKYSSFVGYYFLTSCVHLLESHQMVRKKGGCCRADEACIHKEDSTW